MNLKSLVLSASVSAMIIGGSTSMSQAAPKTQLVNIAFDGYCDGMALTIDINPRVSASIDGVRTGCVSDPVHGAKASIYKIANGVLIATTTNGLDGSRLYTYYIKPDRTWVGYSTGSFSPFNSGTWSYGTPRSRSAPRSTGGK
jgi:hypothetical protein